MKFIKIAFLLCFCLSFAEAQVVSDDKRVADVYFINKEYYAAAEYYKKALQVSPDSLGFVVPYGFERRLKEKSQKKDDYEYAVFQLANSLRLYKNFRDAENWYAIANNFADPKYALSGFWYATCLHANFKYEEAITAYQSFISKYQVNDTYKEKAKLEIESCKYAINEIKFPRLFKLSKLQNDVNGAGSNYAPVWNGQNFYFTSSRPVATEGKNEVLVSEKSSVKVTKKETPYVNTLYKVENANLNGATAIVKKVDVDVKKMEAAAIALHPNGNFVYLTAWVNKEEKKRSIYVAKKEGDTWSEPIALGSEVNAAGFNSIQPFVSKDGKYLLFSSDRPGGFGKYDLWYAAIRPDGTIGSATNMGPKINTSEDEQAPTYNAKTKKLLYSSNGKIGLGGFDFYETQGDFNTWAIPNNMGYPFNSPKDDIYYTALDDMDQQGYISSDRESVCCLEVFHVTRSHLTISGVLIDCATMKPIAGVAVTVSGVDISKNTTLTDANGQYRFQVTSNRGLQLNAVKESYFAKNISYNYEQLAKADTLLRVDLCLDPIIIDKPIVLKNIFYEFDSAELTDTSKLTLDNLYTVMVDNPNIEIELSAHTDIIGSEAYNLDLSDRRAKSCVNYLVGKGIEASRMTWKGYGFSVPIAPNKLPDGKDNPEGRALNRRTEFKVTKK